MKVDIATLPDDPEALKRIIARLACEQERFAKENDLLRERVRLLYAKLFGKKSEKRAGDEPSPQLLLFDMPEPAEIEPAKEAVEVEAHVRRKRGRKPPPADLPRVDVVHDIDENDKTCGCGAALARIGEEVSEKLDIIPAVIQVIRHIRPKYACKHCEVWRPRAQPSRLRRRPGRLSPKA